MSHKKTIALDFDGVLHNYSGWNDGKLSGPIQGAADGVKLLLDTEGCEVVVFTTRDAATVVLWLEQHGFPALEVTNVKRPFYVMLDDRAVQFGGCWTEALVQELTRFQPYWAGTTDNRANLASVAATNTLRCYGAEGAVVALCEGSGQVGVVCENEDAKSNEDLRRMLVKAQGAIGHALQAFLKAPLIENNEVVQAGAVKLEEVEMDFSEEELAFWTRVAQAVNVDPNVLVQAVVVDAIKHGPELTEADVRKFQEQQLLE